ncbi:MAG: TIM barrel protein [Candidatus Nealsonbacteria bacterium]
MIKYGIKLWSINKECFKEAVELFEKGKIDFIELYIVPDSFELKEFEIFKDIPTILHTPHLAHNFNVFDLQEAQIEIFKNQVVKTADFLNSSFIILHSGIGQSKEIFQKNTSLIQDKRILIENLPKISLDDRICFGYSLEQLEFIKECGFDVCLDLGHAVKSATSQKLDYKYFIESLISKLKPFYFHISGVEKDKEKDKHLNLFEGNFDLRWMKDVLVDLANERDIYLVFEVPKTEDNLENYIKNIEYFKSNV